MRNGITLNDWSSIHGMMSALTSNNELAKIQEVVIVVEGSDCEGVIRKNDNQDWAFFPREKENTVPSLPGLSQQPGIRSAPRKRDSEL
jgi:hypothetical protein